MGIRTRSITLANLADSGVGEKFDREIGAALKNVRDPNRHWKQPRKITLTVTFKAIDEQCEELQMESKVETKFAGMKPEVDRAYLGVDDRGRIVAATIDPRQRDLFGEDAGEDINPIKPGSGQEG